MISMFCCCECGNNDFVEITITTDCGDEFALECVRCHDVRATESLVEIWFADIPDQQ